MTARIFRFPLPQEPIRLAMPQVDPGLNWLLIGGTTLCFGIWICLGIAAWRFFHG